jgi:hypothetical protein
MFARCEKARHGSSTVPSTVPGTVEATLNGDDVRVLHALR